MQTATNTRTFTTTTTKPSQPIRDMLSACRQSKDDWARRHYQAWLQQDLADTPIQRREVCIRKMIVGWAQLGESHQDMYGAPIGQDAYCCEHFAQMGHALRDMLNGETGAYDCGTLDRLIVMIANVCGVDLDESSAAPKQHGVSVLNVGCNCSECRRHDADCLEAEQ